MPPDVGSQGETVDSVRTMKEFFTVCPRNCFGSCRLKIQIQDGRLLKVLPGGSPAGEVLCRRAARFPDYVHNPRRLQRPMIRSGRRGDGEFRPCSWDDILRVIQEKLSGLKASFGAQSILMLEGSGNMGVARLSQWHFWEAFGGCSLAYGGSRRGQTYTIDIFTYFTQLTQREGLIPPTFSKHRRYSECRSY